MYNAAIYQRDFENLSYRVDGALPSQSIGKVWFQGTCAYSKL
jgi:hypothetical protein